MSPRSPAFALQVIMLGLVAGTAAPAASRAPEPAAVLTTPAKEPHSARKWPGGRSERGTLGLNHLESAIPLRAGSVVLTLTGKYSTTSDLFVQGDTNERHAQRLGLVWAPIEMLAISVSQSTVSNKHSMSTPNTVQSLGDPTLGLKLSSLLGAALGVGLSAEVLLPTSAGGTGLATDAYVVSISGLTSYLAAPWLVLTANAGYRLDNSRKIFNPNRELTAPQRFTAHIAEVDQIVAGLGAGAYFSSAERFAWGLFTEVTAGMGMGTSFSENPLLASLGARVLPLGRQNLELVFGADVRLSGAPSRENDALPGLPPWEAFARLSTPLGGSTEEVVLASAPASRPSGCIADAECAAGQSCMDGVCSVLKEVVKEVVKEIEKVAPTFVVEGGVVDQTSGEPIGNAVVSFSGFNDSLLAVGYKSGKFRSWPIPASEGLMKIVVSAPGYRSAEQTISKGGGEPLKTALFKLQSLGEDATGEVKGSLKDSRRGTVLRGEIFIPALGKKIRTEADGSFAAALKAGRYQVLISAKKYVTQKKEIEIRAGDVVILNVDMNAK